MIRSLCTFHFIFHHLSLFITCFHTLLYISSLYCFVYLICFIIYSLVIHYLVLSDMYTYIIITCSVHTTIMDESGGVWDNSDKHIVYYYIMTLHYTFIHVLVSLSDKSVVPAMAQIQLQKSSRGRGSFQLGEPFAWRGRRRRRCSSNRAAIARRRPAR